MMIMMQLGFGGVGVDLLATVDKFPNPDDKIRSTNLKVLYTIVILWFLSFNSE